MTNDDVVAAAEGLRWYHVIELVPGYKTKGLIDPAPVAGPFYGIPDQLIGKTVMDIGCWDGGFSIECAKRGAELVIASDDYAWSEQCWGDQRACALATRSHPSIRIARWRVDSYEWHGGWNLGGVEVPDAFDVVLFLGVLYHLRDPLAALQRAADVLKVGGLLIVETHVSQELKDVGFPAARFYPGQELANDPTNWWGPNVSCVLWMLRAVGLLPLTYQNLRGDRFVVHATKAR